MAAQSPREAAYSVTSPLVPPAQPARTSDDSVPPPPSDAISQRSNSTRRRKPSGSNSTIDPTPIESLPSAPDPPRAPRGPPLSYKDPYDTSEQYVQRAPPSSKSFAARAGIRPEQYSAQYGEISNQERSPVIETRSQRISQDPGYDRSPVIETNQPSRRSSQRQSYDPQYQPRSPQEPLYNTVNTGRAIYHQQPMTNGGRYSAGEPLAREPISPQVETTNLPIRSRSQRQSTQSQYVASEKSPLQRLELKLNDISKEEKRARAELAEQKLREREEAAGIPSRRASQPSSAPIRQTSVSQRASSGVSGGQRSSLPQDDVGRRRSQRDVPSLQVDTGSKRQSVEGTTPRSSHPVSATTPGASTKARRVSADTGRADDRGVRFHNEIQDIGANTPRRSVSGNTPNSAALPKVRRAEIDNGSSTTRQAINSGDPDLIPPQAVRSGNDRLNYVIPPQTAAGAETRKQVGFGAGEVATEKHEEHQDHHHLSKLFHRHQENAPTASLPTRALSEWKQGGIAFLTLSDLKTTPQPKQQLKSEEDYQAWWEQGQRSADRRKHKPETAADVGQVDGYFDEQSAPTTFEPPLHLRCGPLLRYCGMRSETLAENTQQGREVWRGSVMIVTQDRASEYSTPPTLRLFHQPMQLLPPPPTHFDEDGGEGLDSEYVDPIGGLPKLNRTGGTVYVKPIEDLEEGKDVSRDETDEGIYEATRTANVPTSYGKADELLGRSPHPARPTPQRGNGQPVGRYREVKGVRLHAERGVTFWRFKIEVELGDHQQRIAYRINRGASVGFWVPARGKSMNVMFHSCNGFSMSVDANLFSGPDPLWRDVLNAHQIKPFHVMIGGGDQIYNDAVMKQTQLFQQWLDIKNPHHKHEAPFTDAMRDELENFYLDRYSMWFSQGLFGMANSQIPMINVWDDHDIIDGFGSYPHHFMRTPVFSGLGNVAYKYYMLFQQQSVPAETTADEPSWLLGALPGPYINELSRSIFMSLGKKVAFLGLDCRTERMRDEILSEATYDLIFERCHREIVKGDTKHLIVLLGVPIAYPRLVWLENVLTSRVLDPVKALGRMGLLGNFMNKFDGGVEILDDLDDHWTAKNHKDERNWFIEELQELAAEKSCRVTILGGDVHLAAVGQFYSNKHLNIPKDKDFRYMPNIISSAIVNTPPPDMMADVLNKRNKVHHLNAETDEDMIPMFTHDVDGKPRNNKHLLPKRNWCSIAEYIPGTTPPATPPSLSPSVSQESLTQKSPGLLQRTLSLGRGDNKTGNKLIRRLSLSNRTPASADDISSPYGQPAESSPYASGPTTPRYDQAPIPTRPISNFHRRPTNLSEKAAAKGAANDHHVDLEFGLDICLNCEIKQGDPSGSTEQYRLLVPALMYDGPLPEHGKRKSGIMKRFGTRKKTGAPSAYLEAGGSKTGGRDSWGAHSTSSLGTQSVSSQGSEGQRTQTGGLFRRLSNRLSRSNSQNRGAVLQKRRPSMDVPARTLEPFKPRPTTLPAQVHQEEHRSQQPLQSALRQPGVDPTGAYTVTANSPRSPPTSFSQRPYNPQPASTATASAQQQTTQYQQQPATYNKTKPIPRRTPAAVAQPASKRQARAYSFSDSEISEDDQHHQHPHHNTNQHEDEDTDPDESVISAADQDETYPVRQPPSRSNTYENNTHPHGDEIASGGNTAVPPQHTRMPSGRGSGAAKFFGEDLPPASAVRNSGPQQQQRPMSYGGYSGIEAYGTGNGGDSDEEDSGRKKKGKGWRKFF